MQSCEWESQLDDNFSKHFDLQLTPPFTRKVTNTSRTTLNKLLVNVIQYIPTSRRLPLKKPNSNWMNCENQFFFSTLTRKMNKTIYTMIVLCKCDDTTTNHRRPKTKYALTRIAHPMLRMAIKKYIYWVLNFIITGFVILSTFSKYIQFITMTL